MYRTLFLKPSGRTVPPKIFLARVQSPRIFSEKRLHLAHKIAFQKAPIAAICTKIKNYPKTP
jgi:hypothetical protein